MDEITMRVYRALARVLSSSTSSSTTSSPRWERHMPIRPRGARATAVIYDEVAMAEDFQWDAPVGHAVSGHLWDGGPPEKMAPSNFRMPDRDVPKGERVAWFMEHNIPVMDDDRSPYAMAYRQNKNYMAWQDAEVNTAYRLDREAGVIYRHVSVSGPNVPASVPEPERNDHPEATRRAAFSADAQEDAGDQERLPAGVQGRVLLGGRYLPVPVEFNADDAIWTSSVGGGDRL